jgi:hypothetical protein
MRKSVHQMSSSSLNNVVTQSREMGGHFAESLIAVLVAVLELEDEVDGHEQVLAV